MLHTSTEASIHIRIHANPIRIAAIFLLTTTTIALIACPYTKVEESFHIQAIHDFYYHVFSFSKDIYSCSISSNFITETLQQFDHVRYPGVVPRTFVGAFWLALVTKGIVVLMQSVLFMEVQPLHIQMIARFVLGVFNVYCFYLLAYAASVKWKDVRMGVYFLVISAVQFHIPFYSTRTLPNTFALGLCALAFSRWLHDRPYQCCGILVLTATIFRCDVILLIFVVGVVMLYVTNEMTWLYAIRTGFLYGILGLIICVPLDSILWGNRFGDSNIMWAEGHVLFYNTVENKSSDWGTSPWHWYITRAFPRALLGTSILLLPSIWHSTMFAVKKLSKVEKKVKLWDESVQVPLLLIVFGYVSLYSFLPHKEMRFMFPVLSVVNLIAAIGITSIDKSFHKYFDGASQSGYFNKRNIFQGLLLLGSLSSIFVTQLGSTLFLFISTKNYPGGHALAELAIIVQNENVQFLNVFIDVASAMSGVSLFARKQAEYIGNKCVWEFSKAGFEEENDLTTITSAQRLSQFSYLLSEIESIDGFDVVSAIAGSPTVSFSRFTVDVHDSIYIHEKKM